MTLYSPAQPRDQPRVGAGRRRFDISSRKTTLDVRNWTALPAECRVSDLSLELHDLHGARSAMRSAAPAEHGSNSRGE
jgi:hypothetical protein